MKAVERTVGEDVVRENMQDDVVERVGLEE